MTDDYAGTLVADLDHYFGNYVGWARQCHLGIASDDLAASKTAFINSLEKALAANLPSSKGVTSDHLREMIELARGDWSDVETIKTLYRRRYEIRREEYNEEKLFLPKK